MIVDCSICLNSVSVVRLSKRALKDCLFIALLIFIFFSFYLLVKLLTLPKLIGLVNKDLEKVTKALGEAPPNRFAPKFACWLPSPTQSRVQNLGLKF